MNPIADALRILADQVAALELQQAPAPAPEPAPPAPSPEPPPPAPEPPAGLGVLTKRVIDPAQAIVFRSYHSGRGDRYTRNVPSVVLPQSVVSVQIVTHKTGGSAANRYSAASYTLLCDGEPVAVQAAPASGAYLTFQAALTAVAPGWHLFDVLPSSGGETPVPFWMHVGPPLHSYAWAPVQTGSHGLAGYERWIAKWGRVPVQPSSEGCPLAPRVAQHFSHAPVASQLFRRDLLPNIGSDQHHVFTDENGIATGLCAQPYSWSGVVDKVPRVVLRDGPRGIGLVSGATHLQIGRRGGVYFVDSWSMGHVSPDGTVKRLLGWRHGPQGLEMVGNWSAVPEARRGLHEAWGMAWDARTVGEETLDTSLLIDRGDGVMEHPHLTGPVAFIADTQNNRILKATFDPRSHDTPAVVTEFITGLADPFDVVYRTGGTILVSERLAHRVAEFNATTGEFVGTIMQGPALAVVDANRFVGGIGTLEQRRAAEIVAPEGLYIMDEWLYVGSFAQQQIQRKNLVTGQVEIVARSSFASNANYAKIAVSDGTFGPRHSVALCQWDNLGMGAPAFFARTESGWAGASIWITASNVLKGGVGGRWDAIGYSTSVAIRDGRLICSGAHYGITELTKASSGDLTFNATLYRTGRDEYEREGYRLTHGIDGFGQFGYPLPWGTSAAMDYYLTCNGHAQG